MISKKLLSEVLYRNKIKVTQEGSLVDNDIMFTIEVDHINQIEACNVYELAYRCKGWAFKKGWILKSDILGYCCVTKKDGEGIVDYVCCDIICKTRAIIIKLIPIASQIYILAKYPIECIVPDIGIDCEI